MPIPFLGILGYSWMCMFMGTVYLHLHLLHNFRFMHFYLPSIKGTSHKAKGHFHSVSPLSQLVN